MKDILLKKQKSRTMILFKPDKEDDWFVNVVKFEKKSGKQISNSLIIQKDVQQWLDGYIDKGWEISDEKPVEIKFKSSSKKAQDDDDEVF